MKSDYDKGYNKGIQLGRVVRYYDDEYLGNIAHKMANFSNYEYSFKELLRGLRHGIDEQETRRQHRMPLAKLKGKKNPLPLISPDAFSSLMSDPTLVSSAQYVAATGLAKKAKSYIKGRGKSNPLKSPEQYGLMQAVASGTAKVKGISQEIAEKLVRETPAGVRSKFAKLLAKKRNPSEEDFEEAEDVSRKWHGREPQEVVDIDEEEVYEDVGAILADLEELGILTTEDGDLEKWTIRFKRDRPKLCSDLKMENLEIVGGDQELGGEFNGKIEVPLGYCYQIVYETDKHHLEGSNGYPESYEHFFGEEFYKGEGFNQDDYSNSDDFFEDLLDEGVVELAMSKGYLPMVVYDSRNCKIRLVGGKYTIKDVGITD